MRLSTPLFLLAVIGSASAQTMLPVGKMIQPAGDGTPVGSYPANFVVDSSGEYAIVTNIGFREYLSVIRIRTGEIVTKLDFNAEPKDVLRDGLYYGLALDPNTRRLYVSYGAKDEIGVFQLGEDGSLTKAGSILNKAPKEYVQPLHPAGLGLTSDGKVLVAANNQTTHITNYKGSISLYDTATMQETARIETAGFPFGVAVPTRGAAKDLKAYVGSERDSCVEVVDLADKRIAKRIPTGAAPVGMCFNEAQSRLYVANSGSDTISVVDTASDRVVDTIMVRPTDMHGLPGAGPNGVCLNASETRLYVSLADMNAIGVVDLKARKLVGFVPVGWLPTAVASVKGKLLVTEAKGRKAANPNGKPVGEWGRYIQDIIEGTFARVDGPGAGKLAQFTEKTLRLNRIQKGLSGASHPEFVNPGIKHVIYIIKENRTYDNVLGDLPQGNGDPSICLFPRKVTPNQHALAERFVLLDNFHVCAEVSQDGWVWSTAGMISQYASRNTPYNYSDRGRSYDTEGSTNGIPVDLIDIPDVSRPPSGYIWELCKKNGVSFRNYGFFTQFIEATDKRHDIFQKAIDNAPVKKVLQGMTDHDFRRYDLTYADSELCLKFNWDWTKRRKAFGAKNYPSRFSAWHDEFKEYVKRGNMPRFQMVRFPVDHTAGTAVGYPTPEAMVCDNDYAVGQLVEAVSHSPFWKSTLICVLEDDAQAGYDHVDAHRSTAYVISPFVIRGSKSSRFYNTDSMLRTMELCLGLPPMSQYDAVATPICMGILSARAKNDEPFKAILPDRDVFCQENKKTAYRSKDSARISNWIEEGDIDEDLNDILWGAIRGTHTPRPTVRRGFVTVKEGDD